MKNVRNSKGSLRRAAALAVLATTLGSIAAPNSESVYAQDATLDAIVRKANIDNKQNAESAQDNATAREAEQIYQRARAWAYAYGGRRFD